MPLRGTSNAQRYVDGWPREVSFVSIFNFGGVIMRKLLRAASIVVVLTAAVAAPAAAQEDFHRIGVNFGGGWMFPLSGLKDSFNTGWTGEVGVTYNVSPKIGIQLLYAYDKMDGPARTINVFPTPVAPASTSGILESNQHIHSGILNMVYTPSHKGHFGGYLLGGIGIYDRAIEITTPSVGYGTVCDPYWYVCYPSLVSIDQIIGSRSSTDFGIDIGGGITFGHSAKLYVETRYHYVWGPTVTAGAAVGAATGTTGTSYSTNAQYLPLAFGLRW
jgi:opacity protein-like surface antigen